MSLPYVSQEAIQRHMSEKPDEPDGWEWAQIGIIALGVIGALVAAFGGICMAGMFPVDILGGTQGAIITMGAGAVTALSAGLTYYFKWGLC